MLNDANYLPSEVPDTCSNSLMGQAVAYACPQEYSYIYNSNSFIQNGPANAINYLSLSSDELSVASLSQETDADAHNSLMLLKSGFSIVRVSQAGGNSQDLSMTPIYTLNSEFAPSAVKTFWQFDTFTLVNFEEGSFFVAFPPSEPTQEATYGNPVRYGSTTYVLRIDNTETPVMASNAAVISGVPQLFVVTALNNET